MATRQIVIELSDRLIKKVKDHYVNPYEVDEICEAILNGTPLPEHHGRLIDKDKMMADLLTVNPQFQYLVDWCLRVTEAQPAIIEADKGVLEKINEKQDSLRATCKAWDEAIEKNGYVN